MGYQCPPCATGDRFRRPQICSETFKAEACPKNAPASSRQSLRTVRVLAKTADRPLVPRRPWPKGVPAPSGRKGKSISPSIPEKAITIFTPPMTKEVEVARQSQSQILKRTSSCGTSLHTILDRPTRGTNAPTISTMLPCILHLAKKHALESYKESFSLLGDNHLHLSCAKDDCISCVQQDGAGMCKCRMSDETVPVAFSRSRAQREPVRQTDQAHSSFDTFDTKFDTVSGIPVDQRITCTESECKAFGGHRAACTLDERSEGAEPSKEPRAEPSKRSDHNFKVEEMEEDTSNHTAETSNSDYLVPCRCSICARRAP